MRRVLVSGVVLLLIGGIAYLALRPSWLGSILAHAGAFGLVVLLAAAGALIAVRKGYLFGRALALGVALPIICGLVGVLMFYLRQGVFYCGGVVVLGVSLLLIIGTALLPRKAPART